MAGITLKIPEKTIATLYEASQVTGGLDIADKDWDMGVYFECPKSWEEANDGYDKFMLLLGCNIRVEQFSEDWYTTCYIAEFMWENRDVFDKFFNENNRKGYRPMDYKDLDPEADTGFYEAYMEPFESLLIGNYSDDDYMTLYKMLAAKAEKKSEEI